MEPLTRRAWRRRDAGSSLDPRDLARQLQLPELVAEVLTRRKLADKQAVTAFLTANLSDLPEPDAIPGMAAAIERLATAVVDGEKILVHGDYDVDGITGTALLVEVLRAFRAEVEFHIPLRLRDGYGLSAGALREAARRGVRVVLSVDCGISAVAEAALARELGLDLIVTDHHLPPAELPCAVALVNPRLEPSAFPAPDLAGVGVAFFLAVALRRRLRAVGHFIADEPDLRLSLDLVALGTIADVVPLIGVNRLLVKKGLELIERTGRSGLSSLLEVAGVARVSCGSVGFQLAPRLNAAGRLEDAALGVELLLCDDPVRAGEIARRLDLCNRERREIEQATLDEVLAKVKQLPEQQRSIVLAADGWHAGVIGIVASRLVERFHRPTLLIAMDGGEGKGSGRSIPGFQLFDALSSCRDYLAGYGGHSAAAGFSLARVSVESFVERFEEVCRDDASLAAAEACRYFDAEVGLAELDLAVVDAFEQLAPFGIDNPEPLLCVRNVQVQQLQRLNGGHLRFTARQDGVTLPCIGFAFAEREAELNGPLDLLVAPQVNRWNGRRSVQLVLKDVRQAAGEGQC